MLPNITTSEIGFNDFQILNLKEKINFYCYKYVNNNKTK